MKIQTIVIGEYKMSPAVPFCLYQIPSMIVTPPRLFNDEQKLQQECIDYFCLEDLFSIFDLQKISFDLYQSFKQNPNCFLKDEQGRSYVQTHVMAEIALNNTIYTLANLCKLSDSEILNGGAIALLKTTTYVRLSAKPAVVVHERFQSCFLDGSEWFLKNPRVKCEPLSPTLPAFIMPSPSFSPQQPARNHHLSPPRSPFFSLISRQQQLPQPMPSTSITTATSPIITDENQIIRLPKPSSLLLKRLAPKHGYKKNLTILTSSYNEEGEVISSIQSAPLRRPSQLHVINHSIDKNRISKNSPLPLKQLPRNSRLVAPATAVVVSAPWPHTAAQTQFPSPPVVPSQQQSWSRPRQPQNLRKQVKTATAPSFPRTPTVERPAATPLTATIPTAQPHLSQKQKFLQPFEYLYNNIEQTRVLKSTLDDQIRRSSSLMQTLQSSNTMIESLVRQQIRTSVEQAFKARLDECAERILKLERYNNDSSSSTREKNIPISPAVSPTREQQPQMDDLSRILNRIDQLESKLRNQ